MRECDLSSVLSVQSWLGGTKGGAGAASVAFKEDIVAAEDLSRRTNRTNNAIASKTLQNIILQESGRTELGNEQQLEKLLIFPRISRLPYDEISKII
jgi:hypothetical protein